MDWFKSREAVDIGIALADQIERGTLSDASSADKTLPEILRRADAEVRPLRLNFYKRARFANSFKWRLIEKGIDKGIADRITQALAVHLAIGGSTPNQDGGPSESPADSIPQGNAGRILARGHKRMAERAYADAIAAYQDLLQMDPRHLVALNNLGAAYFYQGQYKDAEDCFRQAVAINPNGADAHGNLGSVLRTRGNYAEAEISLRRALKLNPTHVDARINLGLTLATLNRSHEAKGYFSKVLRSNPRNVAALNGMAFIARIEGRFDEAESLVQRVLDIDPKQPAALASVAGTRKMTAADSSWLERAEKLAAAGIPAPDEVDLRFAIGKYHDDAREYERAFQNFERANDLQKSMADDYDRDARRQFVDELIRLFPLDRIMRARAGVSDSAKPVLVVGMPRSGTSLVEQIIASHPSSKGAGEVAFWAEAVGERGIAAIAESLNDESATRKLTDAYLSSLVRRGGDAARIVDKSPVNSDYLGVIHSFFPKARIIYMRRDPIDTCLSCYFQKFLVSLSYSMDLEDLADYYREHHRLMMHWRAVLPPGTLLDVPYAELVADQEGWTRKILNFLGLEWDERCLDFYKTQRAVATASLWQVRQKIFGDSVARWHGYKRFIAPLLSLEKLEH